MKNKICFPLTISLLMILFSCDTQKNIVIKSKESISSGLWVLEQDNERVKGLFSQNLSLFFNAEEKKISGFSGCNDFVADIVTNGQVFEFKNIKSKESKCPFLKNEIAYLDALKNVNSYGIKGKELYLYKGNILLLKFVSIGK